MLNSLVRLELGDKGSTSKGLVDVTYSWFMTKN